MATRKKYQLTDSPAINQIIHNLVEVPDKSAQQMRHFQQEWEAARNRKYWPVIFRALGLTETDSQRTAPQFPIHFPWKKYDRQLVLLSLKAQELNGDETPTYRGRDNLVYDLIKVAEAYYPFYVENKTEFEYISRTYPSVAPLIEFITQINPTERTRADKAVFTLFQQAEKANYKNFSGGESHNSLIYQYILDSGVIAWQTLVDSILQGRLVHPIETYLEEKRDQLERQLTEQKQALAKRPGSPATVAGLLKEATFAPDQPSLMFNYARGGGQLSRYSLKALINEHTIDGDQPNRFYWLLNEKPHEVTSYLTGLGLTPKQLSQEEQNQLLAWIYIYDPIIFLRPVDLAYLCKQTAEQIYSILAPLGYPGPPEKTYLLYAALSGLMAPVVAYRPHRYAQLQTYPPINVLYAAMAEGYKINDYETRQVIAMTPAKYLASRIPTIMEPFYLAYDPAAPPFPACPGRDASPTLIAEQYPVYTRNSTVLPLPPRREAEPQTNLYYLGKLEPYTNEELAVFYGFDSTWCRDKLIKKIIRLLMSRPRWMLENKTCQNAGTMNIVSAEARADEADNPLISYGFPDQYVCYNVDELVATWSRTPESGFTFSRPDNIKEDFPLASLKQLLKLDIPTDLQKIIRDGFRQLSQAEVLVETYRKFYLKAKPATQQFIDDYLLFLLVFGIYLRFWKGPGFVYPLVFTEARDDDRCSFDQRNDQVTFWGLVRDEILEEADQATAAYLRNLVRINQGKVGREKIEDIAGFIQKADYCMASGSDVFLQTGYYYLQNLLGWDDQQISQAIRQRWPEIYRIYGQPVETRLIKEANQEKVMNPVVKMLLDSLAMKQLTKDLPHKQQAKYERYVEAMEEQPAFQGSQITASQHMDPYHRIVDLETDQDIAVDEAIWIEPMIMEWDEWDPREEEDEE